ncbi:hypothetical protein [Paludisphaera soli]|uniref:hypothetical protein n=1 Tax=Paludisphaera soli TaxID=2712865 RepID=UPI0013EB7655|nr:hypothetical protein [Paludisphaera soli]
MVILRRVAMLVFIALPMSLSFVGTLLSLIGALDYPSRPAFSAPAWFFVILPAVSAALYGMGAYDRMRGRSWPGWVDGVAFVLLIPGLLIWGLMLWIGLIIAAHGGGSIVVWQ